MNLKIRTAFMVILATVLLAFLCTGAAMITYADTDTDGTQTTETTTGNDEVQEPEQETPSDPVNDTESGENVTGEEQTAQPSEVTEGENSSDNAEDTTPPENTETPDGTDGAGETDNTDNADNTDESGESDETIGDIALKFVAYLKSVYGADYEFYYNQIIEEWGSIEAYLMAFGDKLPEEHQNAWSNFVGWLREYSPIWATVLAVAIVIIIALIGKKQFIAIVDNIVIQKLSPIVKELNKQTAQQEAQATASATTMHALKALMGTNAKFADSVKELEESEKGLTSE